MKKTHFLTLIAVFGFGFVLGVAFVNRSKAPEAGSGEFQMSDIASSSEQLSRNGERSFNGASFTQPAPLEVAPDPIDPETETLGELDRRRRAGEFILDSEDPRMVRQREQLLQHAIENAVPIVITDRHEFLSGMAVPDETIAKLTNHAARIAEASWAVGPLLTEISVAKVEYDEKAQELLTPEQYQKFREFETRQTLQKEWKRFNVDTTDHLSLSDLKAVTRSLEVLGIREVNSSTQLPYDPSPTAGNWITGAERDLAEVMRGKILRVDAATADFATIAERNRLSEAAKKTLADMIANRAQSLRNQLNAQQEQAKRTLPPHLRPR